MSSKQPYLGPSICDIGRIDTMYDKEREYEINCAYDKHKCNILEGNENRISYDWSDLESDRFGIWLFHKPSCVFLFLPWYFVEYNESKESVTLRNHLGDVNEFDNIDNFGYVKRDKNPYW